MQVMLDIVCTPRPLSNICRTIILSKLSVTRKSIDTCDLSKHLPKSLIEFLNFGDMQLLYDYIVANCDKGTVTGWIEPPTPHPMYYGVSDDMHDIDASDSDLDTEDSD